VRYSVVLSTLSGRPAATEVALCESFVTFLHLALGTMLSALLLSKLRLPGYRLHSYALRRWQMLEEWCVRHGHEFSGALSWYLCLVASYEVAALYL